MKLSASLLVKATLFASLFMVPVRAMAREWETSTFEFVGEPRCPLKTNTVGVLYQEFRDISAMTVLAGIARNEPVLNGSRLIVFGGDDDSFSISIGAFDCDPTRDAESQVIIEYAKLRWMGISQAMAVKLIADQRRKVNANDVRLNALKDWLPWLSASRLEPVGGATVVALPGFSLKNAFILKDVYVSYVIRFSDDNTVLYQAMKIDSREFSYDTRSNFLEMGARAERFVSTTMYKDSDILFWRELKRLLASVGIDWLSPEELSPYNFFH